MENKSSHLKKTWATSRLILTTLFLWLFILVSGAEANSSFTINFNFKKPRISRSGNSHSVIIEDLPNHGSPGLPVLPYKTAKILIPYGKDVSEVRVLGANKATLEGSYQVEYGQRPVPISFVGPIQDTPPNEMVYQSTAPFPHKPNAEWSIQSKQGYRFLMINLYPVEYSPAAGRIDYYSKIIVKVTTATARPKSESREKQLPITGRLSIQDKKALEWIVDNPELVNSYLAAAANSAEMSGAGAAMLLSPGDYKYVIITNAALQAAPEPFNFQLLVSNKTSQGVTATIVTTEWIYANYSGVRPDGGTDNQTRIRNFIIDAYTNWGTKYVLLGGDADGANVGGESGNNIIPARGFSVDTGFGEVDNNIPADMYYACLDGSFDSDADGLYGEPTDGPGGGEVDLFAEVYVGRAPVDSATEVSNFVRKTIADATAQPLKKALMLGEYLGWYPWGCDYKDEVRTGSCNYGYCTEGFPPDWVVGSLCDEDYFWSGTGDLAPALNGGYYIVNHLGHSDVGMNMKLYNSDVDALTNSRYFLAYSQGCYSGSFDNRTPEGNHTSYDSIAEHFVTQANGAFAVIMNSRYGWGNFYNTDGASQYYDRQFFDAYFGEWKLELGVANQDSKEDNAGFVGEDQVGRWCCYEITLFGDPQASLANPSVRAGTVELDRDYYPGNGPVGIFVMDSDLNANPALAEQHTGLLTISAAGGDSEAFVTLTETEPNSSRFFGTITTSTSSGSGNNNGTLRVNCSDTITVTYHDADDGTGHPANPSDTAAVDCTPPVLSGIASSPSYVQATITWSTNEPATSKVIYGTSRPPGASHVESAFVTAHTITLTGLTPSTIYYYSVESADQAGNLTVDDNGGNYYQFTTLTPVTYRVPDNYPTIQAAIDAIPSYAGNEIIVRPGIYSEKINFQGKALRLRGEGGGLAVINGGGSGSVVTFNAGEGAGSVLEGFKITNGSAVSGGGIYCGSGATPTIINCIVSGNSATKYGGGLFSSLGTMPTVLNCTFSNNWAGQYGGGIFSEFRAWTTMRNSIVWGNSAGFGNGQIDAYNGNTIDVAYSDIQGGWAYGTGNLDCDPQFLGSGDFHLLSSSCCVDAGSLDGAPAADIDGDARPQGGGVDIGADESRAHVGLMALDRKIYPLAAGVSIVIMDSDLNTNPGTVQTYTNLVTLTTTGGDREANVTLEETAANSGIFRGSIATSTASVVQNNGVLQITCGIADIITATYVDADDGSGHQVTITDSASTDCYAPAISTVACSFTNFDALITWNTNESADSRVRYGTSPPPSSDSWTSALVASHGIALTGLTPGQTYYYQVESTDYAGNPAVDNNNGQYYQFTTPALGIHYVPDEFPSIQAAINGLSSSPQNEIVVRAGTYRENINFQGRGLLVRSEDGPATTIIDGGQNGSVVTFNSGEGADSILRGFTITNGKAFGDGGGIYCSSSPTIDNCIITGNRVQTSYIGFGAGIALDGSVVTSPTITNCTISGNYGAIGSGISARFGGSYTIRNCTISNNAGQGLRCYNSRVEITNCTINNNSPGIEITSSAAVTISNSVIRNNSGSGISTSSNASAFVTNCLITDNLSSGLSFVSNSASSAITNCTISNNSTTYLGGGIYCNGSSLSVVNSILWGNTANGLPDEIYLGPSSSITVAYSDIRGGWTGTGNINTDPLFAGGGDYHLTAASPCKDHGTSDSQAYPRLPADDIDGDPRPQNAVYDIGADEYRDTDGDGYPVPKDCNDADSAIHPGAAETCDGIDNDCDGTVDEGLSHLGASPASLSFIGVQGTPSPAGQTLNVWNTNCGILTWSASDNAAWLSASPASGSSTGPSQITAITVSVDITGLTGGDYNATLILVNAADPADTISIPVSLQVQAPDLIVADVSGPANANEGAAILINLTVKNQGSATAPASTAKVYLSASRLIATIAVNSLAPNAQQSFQNYSVTLPWDLGAPSYIIGAFADANGVVSESNENNNIKSGNTINLARPDLSITAASNSVSTVAAGNALTVSATAKNAAPGTISSGSFKIGLFLSTDTVWNSGDTWLAESAAISSLAVGRTSSKSSSVTIPVTTAPGTYYILAYADYLASNQPVGAIGEHDDSAAANTRATAALTVTAPPPPNLVVNSVSAPTSVTRGVSFNVSTTIKNSGSGASPAGGFRVGIYLSTNNVITPGANGDQFLTSYNVTTSLAAGATTPTQVTPVTISTAVAPGTYYIGAYADDGYGVVETSETDNGKANSKSTSVK